MFGIGSTELLVIMVVALLIFGPQRLPELARMLAKGLREVRKAADDIRSQVEMEEIIRDTRGLLRQDDENLTVAFEKPPPPLPKESSGESSNESSGGDASEPPPDNVG